jgi:streptomycin 6-kinase
MERADANHSLERAPVEEAIEVAGTLLRRLGVTAPSGVRTFAEELGTVATDLQHGWSAFGQPFPESWLVRALTAAKATHSDANTLVNTDLHYGNVLRATREPWLVIDPKVIAGELEYGAAQLLWSRFDEMGGAQGFRRRFGALVASAGLDAQRAHLWALVRILKYWIWALGQGFTEDPQRCRQLSAWLIDQDSLLTARSA